MIQPWWTDVHHGFFSIINPNIEKYIAGADKPPGDVFNIDILLYVFVSFRITGSHRILLITDSIAPAYGYRLQMVSSMAGCGDYRYMIESKELAFNMLLHYVQRINREYSYSKLPKSLLL